MILALQQQQQQQQPSAVIHSVTPPCVHINCAAESGAKEKLAARRPQSREPESAEVVLSLPPSLPLFPGTLRSCSSSSSDDEALWDS